MADNRSRIGEWLRQRTPQHLELLDKMRDSLMRHMPVVGMPDREWARVAGLYLSSWNAMSAEERERAKLLLMAARSGNGPAPIPDDELEAEIKRLAEAALKELPTADLAIELANRGLTMPNVSSEHEDPD